LIRCYLRFNTFVSGPEHRLEAALSFYRALRVAPGAASVNFFQILESTQPPEVFKLLMELVTLDVSPPLSGSGRGGIFTPSVEEITPTSSVASSTHSPPPSESDWERLANSSVPA
jgi:hypothetical protein